MKVEACNVYFPTHRTGNLLDINVSTISEILGFEPNVDDDPNKVVNSWAFIVGDEKCAVWDWKGSEQHGMFSTYGPSEIFEKLFGMNYL